MLKKKLKRYKNLRKKVEKSVKKVGGKVEKNLKKKIEEKKLKNIARGTTDPGY